MDQDTFNDDIFRMVGITASMSRHAFDRLIAEAGMELSAQHAIVIANLCHHDGLTQQQITRICHRDKATTTRVVDHLEEHGLAKRVKDSNDRRQNIVHATPRGRKLMARLQKVKAELNERVLADISDEELSRCRATLCRLQERLAPFEE